MDKLGQYTVRISYHAKCQLEHRFAGIMRITKSPSILLQEFFRLEQIIMLLQTLPYKGRDKNSGRHAFHGYRQLHISPYMIIYKIIEEEKVVDIVHVET